MRVALGMFLLLTTTSRALRLRVPTASLTTSSSSSFTFTTLRRGATPGLGGAGACLTTSSLPSPRFIRGGAGLPSSSRLRTRQMATKCEGEGDPQSPSKVKVALCQILVGDEKEANIKAAKEAITKAAATGAKVIALPECWNSPYATTSFPQYAETISPDLEGAPSVKMLVERAKSLSVYLIGGSVPERDGGKIYNTCVVVGPVEGRPTEKTGDFLPEIRRRHVIGGMDSDGKVLAKHRKVHLFDIDVPGRITFKESDTLTAGDTITVVDTPYGKIGIGICYDIRFPELSMLMRMRGCKILIYPGAFNLTTGPAHWELLQRARAVDNQVFVAAVSPARNPASSYQAWGHTTVVNPWGEVIATTGHEPAMVAVELDLSQVEEVRRNIPTGQQKRGDLYKLVDNKK